MTSNFEQMIHILIIREQLVLLLAIVVDDALTVFHVVCI